MSTFPEPTDGEPVDFLEERDERSESWIRADPREALIEPFGRFGYKVTLRDGENVHYCALGLEDDEYLGRCDCNGWQYHDGPCAHLCTLRKANFLGQIDFESTDGSVSDNCKMHQATGETLAGEPHESAMERAQCTIRTRTRVIAVRHPTFVVERETDRQIDSTSAASIRSHSTRRSRSRQCGYEAHSSSTANGWPFVSR